MSVSREVRRRTEEACHRAVMAALTLLAVTAVASVAVAVARLAAGM